MASRTRRYIKRAGLCLWIACLVVSLVLLTLPVLGDAWTQHENEQTIASIDTACTYETDETLKLLEEAHRYNDELAGISNETPELTYENQLRIEGDEAIGWVEIPQINLRLPMYHGTDDTTLASGIGHVEGTSLPVGGTSSNCALAGHTGMVLARMFDNIAQLSPGDLVIVHVLGNELVYAVEESYVVWPWETEALEIQPGRDLVTLITCTPYGINDHRLIVRASRVELDSTPEPDSEMENLEQSIDMHTLPLIVGFAIAFCACCLFIINAIKKRKR